jgi:predicted PurR-regulated permease PerM
MAEPLEECQRNSAFVAFMLLVCFAALIFICDALEYVLVPLVWSAFFAIPLTLLISFLNRSLVACASQLNGTQRATFSEAVEFRATSGEDVISLNRNSETLAFLERVNNPCAHTIRICSRLPKLSSYSRRRVKIAHLSVEGESADIRTDLEENRLVEGWTYYLSDELVGNASDSITESELGSGRLQEVRVRLYLDQEERYPAVIADPQRRDLQCIRGILKVDQTSNISWTIALLLTLSMVSAGIWIFVVSITKGVAAFTANLDDYKKGVQEFVDLVKPILPPDAWQFLSQKAQEFMQDALPALVSKLAASLEYLGVQTLLFSLYLFFWIFEPLPISGPVAQVFKSYLLLKTFVCAVFAGLMAILLIALQCKIWDLFFVLTFLFNYIPEIGPFMSAVLMVPAILFDGHLPLKTRCWNLIWLVIFGTLFKILTGNVLEVRMYARSGGQFMRMHPVIILSLLMLWSALLGITGMFLSVPTMAAVKYYLVSTDIPGVIRHPLLVFIEGDRTGPHRNFVDRQRTSNGGETALVELGSGGAGQPPSRG